MESSMIAYIVILVFVSVVAIVALGFALNNYIKALDTPKDPVSPDTPTNAQVVLVAKSGGQETTVSAALLSITDASANKRYLIRVAPGVYTETETLVLKEFIDIEGSGEGVTVLTSALIGSISTPTVLAGNINSDIRSLTIDNTCVTTGTDDGVALSIVASTNTFSMRNVTVTATDTGTGNVVGISVTDGSTTLLTDVTVVVVGATADTKKADGINIVASTPVLRRIDLTVSGDYNLYGITTLTSDVLHMIDTSVTVNGSSNDSVEVYGIDISSDVDGTGCEISSTLNGSSTAHHAINVRDGHDVKFSNTNFTCLGTNTDAIAVNSEGTSTTLDFNNCVLTAYSIGLASLSDTEMINCTVTSTSTLTVSDGSTHRYQGCTITSTESIGITNSGTLDIIDCIVTSTSFAGIFDNSASGAISIEGCDITGGSTPADFGILKVVGLLEVSNTNISASKAVSCDGSTMMQNCNVQGILNGVVGDGPFTISDSIINASNGVGIDTTGELNINGGTISGTSFGVTSTANITISNATIRCPSGSAIHSNSAVAEVTVQNSIVDSTNSGKSIEQEISGSSIQVSDSTLKGPASGTAVNFTCINVIDGLTQLPLDASCDVPP